MRLRRPDLRVASFEYVAVGPDLALLRLAGEWRGSAPGGVRLLSGEEELAALPEPPSDGSPLWRAAFSASGEALGGPFVLEADDGRTVELPLPVDAALPAAPAPVAEEEPDPAEPELVADEPVPLVEGPPEPVTDESAPPLAADPSTLEALAAAERALQAERARHERAEAGLRDQLRVMIGETADFMGRLEGYELRRAELEKELSWERLLHKETRRLKDAAELERDEAVSRLEPVEEELGRMRREFEVSARAQRQLADARERIAELERRLEGQEELLSGARTIVERGGERLAQLEQRLMGLREEATEVRSENGHAPALVASPKQVEAVERAIEEADRGTELLAQLERRVGELREGIASQPGAAPPGRGRRRFLR